MNKFRIIIVIIFLLISILTLSLILLINNDNNKNVEMKNITTEENGKIYPENSFQLAYKYNGATNIESFYNKLYKLVEYTKNINKIVNEKSLNSKDEIKQYLNDNELEINSKTGIKELNNFIKLIKFGNIASKYETYKTIKLKPETYAVEGDFATLEMEIIFSEEEKICFKVYIGYTEKQSGIIKFIPIVEE